MKALLFDSDDLVCIAVGSGPVCIVTFDSWKPIIFGNMRHEDIEGFGQHAIEKLGYEGIHVIARRNNWYQTPDIVTVLAIIKERLAGRRVFTYGSSMGGYAAINFSHVLDAEFITFSPQYSIDSRRMPDEKRWRTEAAELDFQFDFMERNAGSRGLIFFDPMTKDREHAIAIRNVTAGTLVPCTNAGHWTLAHIQSSYGLSRLVSEVVEGRLSLTSFQRERRRNRAQDGTYMACLYVSALNRWGDGKRVEWVASLFGACKNVRIQDLTTVVTALVRADKRWKARALVEPIAIDDLTDVHDQIITCRMLISVGMFSKALKKLRHMAIAHPDLPVIERLIKKARHRRSNRAKND